jgi:hypothetical protein
MLSSKRYGVISSLHLLLLAFSPAAAVTFVFASRLSLH